MPGPEQIDKSVIAAEFVDFLLVNGNIPAAVAENFEKLIVKGLRLAFFVMRVFPVNGKMGGAGAYFIPA